MKNEFEYSITRKDDEIIIEVDNHGREIIEISMGSHPSFESINNIVGSGTKNVYVIKAPKSGQPYYFKIKKGEDYSQIFGERYYYLDGAINVRDSGGYQTSHGRSVKWGMLLRGDQLNRLSAQDIAILNRVPIRTIVDYRSTHERTLNPNVEIPSVTKSVQCDPKSILSEAAGQASDLDDENMLLIKSIEDGTIPSKYVNSSGEQVMENYRNLVLRKESQIAYRKMFEIYLEPNSAPIIQHCRGGKDRTGFGTALILLALGVSEEDVLEDYRLTEEVRKDRNDFKMNQYRKLTENEDYLDYLYSLIETRTDYLEASLKTIKANYGSLQSYLKDVMRLDDDDFKILRKNYLEEE